MTVLPNQPQQKDLEQLLNDLRVEVYDKHSLTLLENALWSMKHIIAEDKRMTKKNRANFDSLFKMCIRRVETLIKLFESNDALKHN